MSDLYWQLAIFMPPVSAGKCGTGTDCFAKVTWKSLFFLIFGISSVVTEEIWGEESEKIAIPHPSSSLT
jgi:hypothetical protein